MLNIFPKVICQIIEEYSNDIFDNLELMVYDITEKKIRLNIEPNSFSESMPEWVKAMITVSISKRCLLKPTMTNINRNYLTKSYLTSVLKYFHLKNFSSVLSCNKMRYLIESINKYYEGSSYKYFERFENKNLFTIIYLNRKMRISKKFFDNLTENILYQLYYLKK